MILTESQLAITYLRELINNNININYHDFLHELNKILKTSPNSDKLIKLSNVVNELDPRYWHLSKFLVVDNMMSEMVSVSQETLENDFNMKHLRGMIQSYGNSDAMRSFNKIVQCFNKPISESTLRRYLVRLLNFLDNVPKELVIEIKSKPFGSFVISLIGGNSAYSHDDGTLDMKSPNVDYLVQSICNHKHCHDIKKLISYTARNL